MYPLLPAIFQRLAIILLLAAAYAVSGRLSMLLAVPPGFASAIFPPVGLGLGAVLIGGQPLLAGVFLGSTLLNVSLSVSAGAPLSLALLPVSAGIALGSTLQVWLGTQLIRRFLNHELLLINEREILLFLLLGGPVSCVVGASIGVGILHAAHIIPASGLLTNWINWWVGDSIGVLVTTPLTLIFFGRPRAFWSARIKNVAIPLMISSFLVIIAFLWSSETEQQQITQRFSRQAQLMTTNIKRHLDESSNVLHMLEKLIEQPRQIQRQDFARFVAAAEAVSPGINGLSWNKWVRQSERQEFEQQLRADGFENAVILEKNATNQLVPAAERDHYVVVTHIEPLAANRKAIGLNVAADPARQEALDRAILSGEQALTAPINLIQDQSEQKGALLFFPVYDAENIPGTPAERLAKIMGVLTVILRFDHLLDSALGGISPASYQLQLRDITDAAHPVVLSGSDWDLAPYAKRMAWKETWTIAGRVLQLRLAPSIDFLSKNHSQQSWALLAAGLLFSSLLGIFLLSTSGRTHRIRQLVEERTQELSALFNNAVEAIITFDEGLRIVAANPAAGTLFACNNKSLPGRSIATLIPVIEQERDALLGHVMELQGQRDDGTIIPLEVSLSLVEINDHRTYTCMGHDLSERKKIEKLKSEFVSTVSHELRTPLTSISGALGLLAGGMLGTLPEKVMSLITIAKSNSERLISIVNDILDFEKLEAGQVNVNMERHNVFILLKSAIEQNQGYAERYNVHLSLEMPSGPAKPIWLQLDAQRFLQVMANLISNAIKFSPAGEVVAVGIEPAENSIKIMVSDHGSGIPVEFQNQIFQKFAQADGSDSRQRGGTGLGLSITKAIVERMNGYISFHSTEGRGATFYIIFPTQN